MHDGVDESEEEATQRESLDDSAPSGARARVAAWLPKLLRVLPWFSLATGLVGAVMMDRSPDSAWLVLVAALGGWAVLFAFAFLDRLDVDALSTKKRALAKVGRVTALIALQSVMQQSLFFALPFYALASTWLLGHAAFLALLGTASIATLWDPLYERLVARAPMRFLLQVLAAFAACNAILPALGLSNRASLVVSALFAAVGTPLELLVRQPDARDKRRALAVGAVTMVALPLLVVGVLAPAIPPSPLRLVDGAIGTSLDDGFVNERRARITQIPDRLVCATRVAAPRGVKDEIVHVWWKDGHVVDRVPVRIEGGNERGFRTFSRKSNLTKTPAGVWACVVETATGQRLGAMRAIIDVEDAGASPR